jgi:glucose-6-phosphate 1-dehydrogenase
LIDGAPVPGYRREEGVAAASNTPTYAAMRFMIDNWRWQGVPFFLRSGKRMAKRVSEIAIQFRKPPHLMFPLPPGETLSPNVLVIRVQPGEGLSLCFEIKVPGVGVRMTSARMEFGYDDIFGRTDHDAYETLLLDCMAGDATLFLRSDATEAAWRVVDPVLDAWEAEPPADFPNYPGGSGGAAGGRRREVAEALSRRARSRVVRPRVAGNPGPLDFERQERSGHRAFRGLASLVHPEPRHS